MATSRNGYCFVLAFPLLNISFTETVKFITIKRQSLMYNKKDTMTEVLVAKADVICEFSNKHHWEKLTTLSVPAGFHIIRELFLFSVAKHLSFFCLLQIWCEKATPNYALSDLDTNVHSPGKIR